MKWEGKHYQDCICFSKDLPKEVYFFFKCSRICELCRNSIYVYIKEFGFDRQEVRDGNFDRESFKWALLEWLRTHTVGGNYVIKRALKGTLEIPITHEVA